MTLRIKNTSDIKTLFGLTGGFGAFANNEAIKKNPQLIKLLFEKYNKCQFKFSRKKNSPVKVTEIKKIDLNSLQEKTTSNLNIVKENAIAIENIPEVIRLCSKINKRYYTIYCQPNLFGGWSMTRSWGSLSSRLGNQKVTFFDSLIELKSYIKEIVKKKKYRGYE